MLQVPQSGQVTDFLGAGWHFPQKGLQTQHPPGMADPFSRKTQRPLAVDAGGRQARPVALSSPGARLARRGQLARQFRHV